MPAERWLQTELRPEERTVGCIGCGHELVVVIVFLLCIHVLCVLYLVRAGGPAPVVVLNVHNHQL